MNTTAFASDKVQTNGDISVIKVKGYLDATTSEELDSKIDEMLKAKHFNIIVDLHEVEYVSSMGWGVFLSKIRDVRMNDGDLKLARMQPDVYEVYRVLEFELFLKSYDTLAEAIAGFSRNGHAIS